MPRGVGFFCSLVYIIWSPFFSELLVFTKISSLIEKGLEDKSSPRHKQHRFPLFLLRFSRFLEHFPLFCMPLVGFQGPEMIATDDFVYLIIVFWGEDWPSFSFLHSRSPAPNLVF